MLLEGADRHDDARIALKPLLHLAPSSKCQSQCLLPPAAPCRGPRAQGKTRRASIRGRSPEAGRRPASSQPPTWWAGPVCLSYRAERGARQRPGRSDASGRTGPDRGRDFENLRLARGIHARAASWSPPYRAKRARRPTSAAGLRTQSFIRCSPRAANARWVQGAALAHRDPTVARVLPLCFWSARDHIDWDMLIKLCVRPCEGTPRSSPPPASSS